MAGSFRRRRARRRATVGGGRHSPACRAGVHQSLDPVGDLLCRAPQLPDGPVGGVSLGDVARPGVVDQTFGQGPRQQQVTLGDGDECVAQSVVPELRAARGADPLIEMAQVGDMARGAQGGREHPVPKIARQRFTFRPAALEDGRQLASDGQLQWLARLCLLDPEGESGHVDALPSEGQHLVDAHAGVEPEQECVPRRRGDHYGFDSRQPSR